MFTVAENALENARKGNRNVAIIPLGESGSGKSRNIEFMLHYLSRRSLARDENTKEIILSVRKRSTFDFDKEMFPIVELF